MNLYFESKIFVVGDDVSIDDILPKQKLLEDADIGRCAMQGLDPAKYPYNLVQDDGSRRYRIIAAGNNFGCGERRPEAVLALSKAGIEVIIAESYADGFYDSCLRNRRPVPLISEYRTISYLHTDETLTIMIQNDVIKIFCGQGPIDGVFPENVCKVKMLPLEMMASGR